MWYPFLADLKDKGIKNPLIVTFLYNRAVKLPLIPVMIYYFGLKFVIIPIYFLKCDFFSLRKLNKSMCYDYMM